MNTIDMDSQTSILPFGKLFKKYRLHAEISTLSEFGNLLAEEGVVYESSIFTRWQHGNRLPKDRKIIFSIIKVFIKKEGICSLKEVNELLESAGQGYVTKREKNLINDLLDKSNSKKSSFKAGYST